MSHPIAELQAALVAALTADAGLAGTGVFDTPPRDAHPPYIAIVRHDIVPRDGDLAPGFEHRLVLHIWVDVPSRVSALLLAERAMAVAESFSVPGLAVTHRRHERTETAIDAETGRARALLSLRFFTEAG